LALYTVLDQLTYTIVGSLITDHFNVQMLLNLHRIKDGRKTLSYVIDTSNNNLQLKPNTQNNKQNIIFSVMPNGYAFAGLRCCDFTNVEFDIFNCV
jgi:hypothetical protein